MVYTRTSSAVVALMLMAHLRIPLSANWISSELVQAIKDQIVAYQQFVPHLDDCHVRRSSHVRHSWSNCHPWGHSEIEHHYDYRFDTRAARAAYERHTSTLDKLTTAQVKTALGDGFIMGIIITCLGRLIKEKRFEKSAIAALFTALLLAMKQSDTIGNFPYLSPMLEQERSGYLGRVIGRFLGISLGACIGICASNYTLDRTEELLTPGE